MKTFITELRAYCNESKEIRTFAGKEIEANTIEDAEKYCMEYYPYLTVLGELIGGFNDCDEVDIGHYQCNSLYDLFKEGLKTVNQSQPIDLKDQLNIALEQEDYKEAARLRDLINGFQTLSR